MKAYMYASARGAEAGLLSQCFADFAELFRHGVLTDTSTVWVNAESPDPGFWALTDRSHYVWLHRSSVPGYARVTKGRIRWARSYNDTTAQPELDIDAAASANTSEAAVTLVVKHRSADRNVSVINDKLVELTNGVYTQRNLTVIDLPHYRSPGGQPVSASEFEANDARYHGANHLMRDLDDANAELVRRHLELFAADISAEQLASINEHLDVVDRFAGVFAEQLLGRLTTTLSG